MEQPHTSDGCGPPADRPRDVRVTIVRTPQPHAGRARVAGVAVPTRAVIMAVLLLAAVAAVITTTSDTHLSPARVAAAPLAAAGTIHSPPAAAVYRYPLGCLGASLSPHEPAAGSSDRRGPCWRYGVFLTATLHQVHGVWRLGLEAVSRTCPTVSLPASVRLQLVVCRR